MDRTIYKYRLDANRLVVDMPDGAIIRSAAAQGDEICVWAEVDPEKVPVRRYFEVFGTGHEIVTGMGVSREFIDTVHMPQLGLVFHVYERTGV